MIQTELVIFLEELGVGLGLGLGLANKAISEFSSRRFCVPGFILSRSSTTLLQYFVPWFEGTWAKIKIKSRFYWGKVFNHIHVQFSSKLPLTRLRKCTRENKLKVTKWVTKANALTGFHQRVDFLSVSLKRVWWFAYLEAVTELPLDSQGCYPGRSNVKLADHSGTVEDILSMAYSAFCTYCLF